MSEAIPKEVLEAARLKFKRRLAAVVCQAMAEDGGSVEEYSARLGWEPSRWWREVRGLLEGRVKRLDIVSDLMLAMGCELCIGFSPITKDVEPPARHPTREDDSDG